MKPHPLGLKPSSLKTIALPVLVIVLGMQLLRVFTPSLAWYLKDTVGAGAMTLAIYALGTFLFAFLAAPLRRLAGPKVALWITAGGVAIVRLVEQFVSVPAVDLWLSMLGTALFVMFLPVFIGHVRAQGGLIAAPRLVGSVVVGLSLDSAIRGVAQTLDISWIHGPIPWLLILGLAGLTIFFLATEGMPNAQQASDSGASLALPLLALGPYLVLQTLIFQNQGWIAELTRLQYPLAFLTLMVGNALAALGLFIAFARPRSFHPLVGLAAAVLLGVAVAFASNPTAFLLNLMVSQLIMGWSWGLLATAIVPAKKQGLSATSGYAVLGMLLFLLLTLVYYISLDIAIPIPRAAIIPVCAVLFGLLVLYASFRAYRLPNAPWSDTSPLLLVIAFAAVPLLNWAFLGAAPTASPPTGLPVRVMTYNVHSAFDTAGRQDPEAIAQVIEESNAEIIALQEVSRGWLIDGSTDLAAWLSRRLQMPILFQGTTDPVWGNAILSRYPILEYGSGTLPLVGTRIARGYLWARIDVGAEQPLMVIATHLHHVEADQYVRLEQVPVLLDFWNGAPFTLLMGDMNAEPTYPEMALIGDAGLVDSWQEAGVGEGLTWPSYDPFERIDWIWHTADLKTTETLNFPSTASDHRPVVATLELAGTSP